VQSEDYEMAAELRDKIKKYETGKHEADRSK
jgi:protein-arginine kinase activator protein McsA